jgi:hypothetical protein
MSMRLRRDEWSLVRRGTGEVSRELENEAARNLSTIKYIPTTEGSRVLNGWKLELDTATV